MKIEILLLLIIFAVVIVNGCVTTQPGAKFIPSPQTENKEPEPVPVQENIIEAGCKSDADCEAGKTCIEGTCRIKTVPRQGVRVSIQISGQPEVQSGAESGYSIRVANVGSEDVFHVVTNVKLQGAKASLEASVPKLLSGEEKWQNFQVRFPNQVSSVKVEAWAEYRDGLGNAYSTRSVFFPAEVK